MDKEFLTWKQDSFPHSENLIADSTFNDYSCFYYTGWDTQ